MQHFAAQLFPRDSSVGRAPMKYGLFLSVLLFILSGTGMGSVSVREVDFRLIDINGGDQRWLECQVNLEVRHDAGDSKRKRPEYLDDLVVELILGIESRRNRRAGFEFYRSQAESVSLREGRHTVRFYLPPEIVKRDETGRDPHSFVVRLSRGEEDLGEFSSPSLARENVRQSFLTRVGSEAEVNEGILLPQNETPFLTSYPDSTPSFRRRTAGGSKK